MQIVNIERVSNIWINKTVNGSTYEQLFSGLIITSVSDTFYFPEPFTATLRNNKFMIIAGGCKCIEFSTDELPDGMTESDVKTIISNESSTADSDISTLIFKLDISGLPSYDGVLYSNVQGLDIYTYIPNVNIDLLTETGNYSSLKFSFDSHEFDNLTLLSFNATLSKITPFPNSGEYPPYPSILTYVDPERREVVSTPYIYEYSEYREFNSTADKLYCIAKFLKTS